jgi:hypothetical protein
MLHIIFVACFAARSFGGSHHIDSGAFTLESAENAEGVQIAVVSGINDFVAANISLRVMYQQLQLLNQTMTSSYHRPASICD